MKPLFYTLSYVLLISMVGMWYSTPVQPTNNSELPPPTEILELKKKNKEMKRMRELREQRRHKGLYGVDYRDHNQNLREERLKARMETRRSLAPGKEVRGQEVLADGHLIGTWKERGASNVAGRMHYTTIDWETGTTFSGSDGGVLWKGTLDDTGWEPLNDYMPATIRFLDVQEVPGVGKRLMMAGNKSFFYSHDEGKTWMESTGFDTLKWWGGIERVVVTSADTPRIYILALEWDYVAWNAISKIYYSDDWGASFKKGGRLDGYPSDKDIWTARYGTSKRTFLSWDGDFYEVNSGGVPVFVKTVSSLTGKSLLAGCEVGGDIHISLVVDTGIYRTTNGGTTWTHMGGRPNSSFARSFHSSTYNPDVLYHAGVDCYVSKDGGTNWTLVNPWWEYYGSEQDKLHADVFGINVWRDTTGKEITLINCDGGLYKSFDSLNNVENITLRGIGTSQYYSTFTNRLDPEYVYAGSQDQGFQRCLLDSGGILGFEQTISGDYGQICSGNNGVSLWTVYPGFAMYYPDLTSSKDRFSWDFSSSSWLNGWQWMTPLVPHPTDPTKVYTGGGDSILSGQYIWILEKIGSSVKGTRFSYDFSISGTNEITALEISRIDPNYRYVLTDAGRFFYSTDGGGSWTLSSFDEPNLNGTRIIASDKTLGTIIISGSGYSNPGVFISLDHGATFSALDTDLPSTMINDIKFDEDETMIFAATAIGPYVYVFAEAKWYDMAGVTAPDQDYRSVDFIDSINTARFGTYGRGIWDFRVQCLFPTNLSVVGGIDHADLSWDLITGETEYIVRYKPKGTGVWSTKAVLGNTTTITGLIGGLEYEFQVASKNCDDYTDSEYMTTWGTGFKDQTTSNINLYPNPATDLVYVKGLSEGDFGYKIYDPSGRLVQGGVVNNSKPVDMNALPPGIYRIQISDKGRFAYSTAIVKM